MGHLIIIEHDSKIFSHLDSFANHKKLKNTVHVCNHEHWDQYAIEQLVAPFKGTIYMKLDDARDRMSVHGGWLYSTCIDDDLTSLQGVKTRHKLMAIDYFTIADETKVVSLVGKITADLKELIEHVECAFESRSSGYYFYTRNQLSGDELNKIKIFFKIKYPDTDIRYE